MRNYDRREFDFILKKDVTAYRYRASLIQRKETALEYVRSQVLYEREIPVSTVKISNLVYLGQWKHKVDPRSFEKRVGKGGTSLKK